MPLLERVKFKKGRQQEFEHWLHEELFNTMSDRLPLERKWEDYIVQWRAKLPEGEKDFPWPGAANLEFPLTAIHADPVYSDFLQTLHAPTDFWHVSPRRPDRVPHANALRELLTAVEQDFLTMRDVNTRALLDLVVLGTTIYKDHWVEDSRKALDYDENGEVVEIIDPTSEPRVEHIPLQHFWIPANARSIDPDAPGGARWVAHEFWLTKNQLRSRATKEGRQQQPAYDKKLVDFVIQHERDKRLAQEGRIDELIQEEDEFEPFRDMKIRLFEVWARFDIDGDGVDEDVVLVWHQETDTILRALHNPFLHGKRPFEAEVYLPGFGFYGIGIAEADEWAQATITSLLNAQIDNVTLANTRMFKAPLGSNIEPGEGVYPGKIWFVGPDEDVGEVKLGEIYPSLPQTMTGIMQWSEMRTGVNELRQGNITGLPSRTPATSLLESLRLGNKRFDMILGNMRQGGLGRIGLRILQLIAQYLREDEVTWKRYIRAALGEQDAELAIEALTDTPPGLLDKQFGVTIGATSAQVNKEAEKQGFIGMLQIVAQVYPQLVQTAQLIEQMPQGSMTRQTAEAAYKGGVQLLQRLLERFDIENPNEYLPNLQALAGSAQAQQQGVNPAQAGLAAPQPPAPTGLAPQQLGALFGL